MPYVIKIVRIRDKPSAIYCGRGSQYGNPFAIDKTHNRNDVCDSYEVYFNKRIRNDPNFLEDLKKFHVLGKKHGVLELGCFCSPLRCHTETIKNFIEHNSDMLEEVF